MSKESAFETMTRDLIEMAKRLGRPLKNGEADEIIRAQLKWPVPKDAHKHAIRGIQEFERIKPNESECLIPGGKNLSGHINKYFEDRFVPDRPNTVEMTNGVYKVCAATPHIDGLSVHLEQSARDSFGEIESPWVTSEYERSPIKKMPQGISTSQMERQESLLIQQYFAYLKEKNITPTAETILEDFGRFVFEKALDPRSFSDEKWRAGASAIGHNLFNVTEQYAALHPDKIKTGVSMGAGIKGATKGYGEI